MGTNKSNTNVINTGSSQSASVDDSVKISFQALSKLLLHLLDEPVMMEKATDPDIAYLSVDEYDAADEEMAGSCYYNFEDGIAFCFSENWHRIISESKGYAIEMQRQYDNEIKRAEKRSHERENLFAEAEYIREKEYDLPSHWD